MRVIKHVKMALCLLASTAILTGCDDNSQNTTSYGKSSTGNYLAAKFAFKNNDYKNAIKYTERALFKAPKNRNLLRKLYGLKLIEGDTKDAISLAKRHARLDGASHFTDLLLMLDSIQKGSFSDAEKHLTKLKEAPARSLGPEIENILLPSLTVWLHVGNKDFDGALNILNKQKPEEGLIDFKVYQKALINELAGNVNEAKTLYNDLTTRPYSYGVVKRAVDFYRRNNFTDEAKKAMDTYYTFNPRKTLRSGYINDFSTNNDSSLNEKLVTNQILAGLITEVATLLQTSQKLDDAILYYRLALMLDDTNEQSSILLGGTFEKKGLYLQAIKIYKTIPNSSRYKLSIEQDIAMAYNKLGKTDQAKALLITISQKDPTRVDALLNLGDIMVSNKKYKEASQYYANAVKRIDASDDGIQAYHWPILYALAICYEQDEHWTKAEETFVKALTLSPNEPDVLNYLAYSWIVQGTNLKRAEQMLQIAVTKRPNDAHILDSYGWVLFKLERYKEALFFIEQANRRIPYDPTTNDHLGDLYWKIGRKTEASFMWKRALIFDPKPEETKLINQKIKHGLGYKVEKSDNRPKMVKSDHIRQK